jgi:hypothetical protein
MVKERHAVNPMSSTANLEISVQRVDETNGMIRPVVRSSIRGDGEERAPFGIQPSSGCDWIGHRRGDQSLVLDARRCLVLGIRDEGLDRGYRSA